MQSEYYERIKVVTGNSMTTLTNKEYVNNKGSMCPFCKEIGFTYYKGDVEYDDDDKMTLKSACRKCECEWYEKLEIKGYETIHNQK